MEPTEKMIVSEAPRELSPSIKLSRGMTGKYGWEIRILDLDVKALEKINNEMVERFSGME